MARFAPFRAIIGVPHLRYALVTVAQAYPSCLPWVACVDLPCSAASLTLSHCMEPQALVAQLRLNALDSVYLNMGKSVIWPTVTHRRSCAHMRLLAWHLALSGTTPQALQIVQDELPAFLHHDFEGLLITMFTGVVRIFADKCLRSLIQQVAHSSEQDKQRTLHSLQRPVDCVLAYLGIPDM